MDTVKRHLVWALPVLFLLLLTPFSATLDIFVADMTYYRSWNVSDPWDYGFYTTPFFDFIYLYGVLPAQLIGVIAGICLIASRWNDSLKPFRGVCAVLSLTLFFGSLVITNTLLKECWGRPRPRQIIQFGGSQTFRPYYQPVLETPPEPSKSFPSGHSTCGFYFFCLYFLGKRYKKEYLAKFGLYFGLGLGGILSIARIVQGGHFISDAYIAALIMWETAYFLDYLVFDAPSLARIRKLFFGQNVPPVPA